jgi:hypothetical protein
MDPLEIHKHVAQSSGREVGDISPLSAELIELANEARGNGPVADMPDALKNIEGSFGAGVETEARTRLAEEMRSEAYSLIEKVTREVSKWQNGTNPTRPIEYYAELAEACNSTEWARSLRPTLSDVDPWDDHDDMVRAAVAIAKTLVRGEEADVRSGLEVMLSLANEPLFSMDAQRVLDELVEAKLIQGQVSELETIANSQLQGNAVAREYLMFKIALDAALHRDFDRARELVNGLPAYDLPIGIEIGKLQLEDDDIDGFSTTLAWVDGIDSSSGDQLKTMMVLKRFNGGERDLAIEASVSLRTADAIVAAGAVRAAYDNDLERLHGILEFIGSKTDKSTKNKMLGGVVDALVESGRIDWVEQIAADQVDVKDKDRVLAQLAEGLCTADPPDIIKAKQVIQKIVGMMRRRKPVELLVEAIVREGVIPNSDEMVELAEPNTDRRYWLEQQQSIHTARCLYRRADKLEREQ